MTFYLFLADRNSTNNGARWTIMGIAVKIAQSVSPSIALHTRIELFFDRSGCVSSDRFGKTIVADPVMILRSRQW